MKKLMLIAVLLSGVALAQQSHFCKGYEDGYKQAFCNNGICTPVVPPICPVPMPGADKYADGFQRGLEDGYARRQR